MTDTTPTPAPVKSGFLSKLQWIGVILLIGVGAMGVFDHFREVVVKVAQMESEITEVSKKDALYNLSMIQNKLKTQGAITKDLRDSEAANVQRNMDSKRMVAMGVMSFMNSDLRAVGAPTNGLMELKNSAEFYKTLMDTAGSEYGTLKDILTKRAKSIQAYEMFMADPVNHWFAHLGGYPKMDLVAEKKWTVVTGMAKNANETGVADPINPIGKSKDIAD
jgi:hypothetical protein